MAGGVGIGGEHREMTVPDVFGQTVNDAPLSIQLRLSESCWSDAGRCDHFQFAWKLATFQDHIWAGCEKKGLALKDSCLVSADSGPRAKVHKKPGLIGPGFRPVFRLETMTGFQDTISPDTQLRKTLCCSPDQP